MIAEIAKNMKVGSFFICTTKKIPKIYLDKYWDNSLSLLRNMSWGSATVHFN